MTKENLVDQRRYYFSDVIDPNGQKEESEKYSRGRFESTFSEWIVNSRDEEDFGFDFEVRVTESDEDLFVITPSNFFVQLKASEEFENDESVYWDLDVEFLVDDCLQSPIPVVLMIYERASDEFYWCVLQSRCWDGFDDNKQRWREQQTVRVRIDRSKSTPVDFVTRSNFQSELSAVEGRIVLRSFVNVVNPDADSKSGISQRRIADADDVIEYEQNQLEIAKDLIDSGATSRALVKLIEIYQMPETDEPTLDAILELLSLRTLDHPVVAFVHDEISSVGMEIVRNLNREEDIEFLRKHEEKSANDIKRWLPGATVVNKSIEEEFLVLEVEDWDVQSPDNSMWVAMLQYEDGVFWDESAEAIVSNEKYDVVEFDESRYPVRDACTGENHEFTKDDLRNDRGPAFCDVCGLSERVLMDYLGHDVPFVCVSCDNIRPFSEFREGHICESCHDQQSA